MSISSHVVKPGFALRPFRESDEPRWQKLRTQNHDWLEPWNASDPQSGVALTFAEWVRSIDEDAHAGKAVVLAMVDNGEIVGEVSLGAIAYGSLRSGIVGYWISQDHAGRGLTPLAVALLADWAFFSQQGPHLHRLEVALLPVNANSRRVVEKVGFIPEGLKRHYMHVAGQWRDHETWSLLAEDVVGTVESQLASHLAEVGNGKQQTAVPTAPQNS
jgi:ribosomal-protein-alanine N-acetyltransferase